MSVKRYNGTSWDVYAGAGLQGVQGVQGTLGTQGVQGATGSTGSTGAGNITGFNTQTASYTLVSSDASKVITMNSGSALNLTLPPSVFSANDQINIAQYGAGQVTFVAGSGVTIISGGATSASPKLRAQYSVATAICTVGGATPTFLVVGDIV